MPRKKSIKRRRNSSQSGPNEFMIGMIIALLVIGWVVVISKPPKGITARKVSAPPKTTQTQQAAIKRVVVKTETPAKEPPATHIASANTSPPAIGKAPVVTVAKQIPARAVSQPAPIPMKPVSVTAAKSVKPATKTLAAEAPEPRKKIWFFSKPKPPLKTKTQTKTIPAVVNKKPVIRTAMVTAPKPPVIAAPTPIPIQPPVIHGQGKIAIVIDDWGYSLRNLPVLKQIKQPITAALLPNLAYSDRLAQELHDAGVEVILHLPMQPKEPIRLEKGTITTEMGEREIKATVNNDLDRLTNIVGVSNHQGSMVTEDVRAMGIILGELEKRNLYFLDSYVSPNSVCRDLADEKGIGFASRDIFLDNQEDPVYIKGQIEKLKQKAQSRGFAIGIGHDRKNTMVVLKEMMPKLAAEGYTFVRVSEIVD